jgi:mannose/cellobiose epimerase-like protein (N-acyl-D-glucosamine 2-epimerase family)
MRGRYARGYVVIMYCSDPVKTSERLPTLIRPEKHPDMHMVAACLILYDTQKDRMAYLWL